MESVGYIALNTRLGCVEQDVSEDSESVKIINAVSTIFRNTTALDDTIHYWKFLPSKTFKEYETACGVFKAAVLKHINFALGEIKVYTSGYLR